MGVGQGALGAELQSLLRARAGCGDRLFTTKFAVVAAILISESGATGETKKAAQRFSESGADWETAAARIKVRTDAPVTIRPLIATPAQGVSRSRAETDVLQR